MGIQDLDEKSYQILEAVYENGGKANTTEIKQYTGIEKNAIVHYRYDKLEDEDLITIERGESQGDRLPPKVAILTETAQNHIQNGLFAEEEPTVLERLDRLERQFNSVMSEFDELKQEIREFRYVEEDDRELTAQELTERIQELESLEAQYSKNKTIERRISGIEGDVTKLEGRLADIGNSHSELAESIEENRRLLKSLQQQLSDAFDTIDDQHDTIEKTQDRIDAIESEVQEIDLITVAKRL